MDDSLIDPTPAKTLMPEPPSDSQTDAHCPVCGATLTQEKCKVVCRSPQCTYRIIFNCSEF
jgi:hypothetical protein